MNRPTITVVSASCDENTIIVGTTYATTKKIADGTVQTTIQFNTMCPVPISTAHIYAQFYCWGVWTPKPSTPST